MVFFFFSLDDELNLLVIVVDTNPIWWGKQTLAGSELSLSKCLDATMVLGNSHLFMNRNNKLAVIASHIRERYCNFLSGTLESVVGGGYEVGATAAQDSGDEEQRCGCLNLAVLLYFCGIPGHFLEITCWERRSFSPAQQGNLCILVLT
uniref:General transcription factor IIH subunit 3 n=1 Tax=Varanus komodoensis TaxID=61221 RepID=A0A8D2LB98_VARKO